MKDIPLRKSRDQNIIKDPLGTNSFNERQNIQGNGVGGFQSQALWKKKHEYVFINTWTFEVTATDKLKLSSDISVKCFSVSFPVL